MLRTLTISVLFIGMLAGSPRFPSDTRVADAARENDLATVRQLLKDAADANSSHGDGMTALHWAAWNGNAEMAQLLVYAGATVKATTRVGAMTPMYIAAQYGNAKVVEVLLRSGGDPKAASTVGITPLMMAASSGDTETITALLEAGVDVNTKENVSGQTAIVFASAFNRPDAIQLLARHGAKLDQKSNLITRVFSDLGDRNAPPAPGQEGGGRGGRGQGQQPPAAAQPPAPGQPAPQAQQPPPPQGQRANIPRDATRAGGNPKGQLTPLMYAARQGNLEAASALVEVGAKLNEVSADGSTALLLAAINGEFDVARLLVERGANVNIASVDGTTPLYAVFNIQWARKTLHPQPTHKTEKTHYLQLARMILDKGADPNVRLKKDLWYDGFGFALDNSTAAGATAFWRCADVADLEGMKLLLSRGANPKLGNLDNVNPLLAASGAGFHGNDDVVSPIGRMAAVRFLVDDLHLDVNAVDGRNTPPEPAPAPAPVATAAPAPGQPAPPPPAMMMQQGRAGGGFSALHNAAARGDNEMILFLISRGAKVDVVSKNGNSVVDMANGVRQRVQPYPETIALLEALGAKNSYRCVSC